jgi:hypothetical protein
MPARGELKRKSTEFADQVLPSKRCRRLSSEHHDTARSRRLRFNQRIDASVPSINSRAVPAPLQLDRRQFLIETTV